MQEDNKRNLKRTRINGWNHACSRLHDWFGIFIVSSDMVRQLGSAGWLIAMCSYRDDYGDRCCELR
jgi:hypothetical protein